MASLTNAILLTFIVTFAILLAYSNPSLASTQIGQVALNKTNQITNITSQANSLINISQGNSFIGTIQFEVPLTWVYNSFQALVSLSTAPYDIINSLTDLPQIARTGLSFLLSLLILFGAIAFWRIGQS